MIFIFIVGINPLTKVLCWLKRSKIYVMLKLQCIKHCWSFRIKNSSTQRRFKMYLYKLRGTSFFKASVREKNGLEQSHFLKKIHQFKAHQMSPMFQGCPLRSFHSTSKIFFVTSTSLRFHKLLSKMAPYRRHQSLQWFTIKYSSELHC